jgi:hypothetical protein
MTSTTTLTSTDARYTIVTGEDGVGFNVLDNATGLLLTDFAGRVRFFATRNSARKRISRELRGNYHA